MLCYLYLEDCLVDGSFTDKRSVCCVRLKCDGLTWLYGNGSPVLVLEEEEVLLSVELSVLLLALAAWLYAEAFFLRKRNLDVNVHIMHLEACLFWGLHVRINDIDEEVLTVNHVLANFKLAKVSVLDVLEGLEIIRICVEAHILEIKIVLCVVVRDIFDHLTDSFHLGSRELAVLDVCADHVAEDAAEVLMTRVADEAA